MDDIDVALAEAWSRLAPRLRADRLESRRRAARRLRPILTRPLRAWSLCLRASDRRLNECNTLVNDKWALRRRDNHTISIDAPLLRRLCKPVELPWPGIPIRQAARLTGQPPNILSAWAARGVLNIRRIPGLGGQRGKPVPVVWSHSPIDPTARAGRAPDPIWGPLWQQLHTRIPDGLTITAQRVPLDRYDPRDPPKNRRFCGWTFICPGLAQRFDANGAPGSFHTCGRRTPRLYIPFRPWTMLDLLDQDPAAAAGSAIPGLSAPSLLHPPMLAACQHCHALAYPSLLDRIGWNHFITYISGGLLYGHEVPRPASFKPKRRRPFYTRRRSAPRRDLLLSLITQGLSDQQIAQRMGITRTGAQAQIVLLFRHHNVHGRRGLFTKLYPDRSPPPNARGAAIFRPLSLPPRRAQTLRLLLDGLSYHQIAARQGIARGTIGKAVMHVYRFHNVRSRKELLAKLASPTYLESRTSDLES